MANEQDIQQSLLQSIDYLITNRLSSLAKEQTITCTITECTNSLTGEYKVQYQNGFFAAYAQNETSYNVGDSVYVLVPQGDYSNTKIIISKATVDSNEEILTLLNNDVYTYKKTSANCLQNGNADFPQGLNSYKVHDGNYLYYKIEQFEKTDTQLIDTIAQIPQMIFDENEFIANIARSDYFWLEADFQTNLSYAHKLTQNGRYGLGITFAFKKKDAEEQKVQTNSGWIKYYNEEDIDYRSYTLDSEVMIGNPYRFQLASNQHIVYDIDFSNFIYLKSIWIYSKDFEIEEVVGTEEDDIFISNIGLYTAAQANVSDNNYNLIISPLDGTSFTQKRKSLRIQASVYYKQNSNITEESSQVSFYWFLKDDRIDSSSDNYSYIAGAGWRNLNNPLSLLMLDESEHLAYESCYKVYAIITNTNQDNSPQLVLTETFYIYNLLQESYISLISSRGTSFDFTNGLAEITCLINERDGLSDNFIDNISNDDFVFIWSRTIRSNRGQRVDTYAKTKDQLERELVAAKEAENIALRNGEEVDISLSQSLQEQLRAYNNVTINKNFFTASLTEITGIVEISCTVYRIYNEVEYYFGSTSITLTPGNDISDYGYFIEILNGNQLFQYDEDGISPASDKWSEPQKFKSLEINFYSSEGDLIDKSAYDYRWIIPSTNTLFDFSNILEGTEEIYENNSEYVYYNEDVLPIAIQNEYDISALNNQIKIALIYDNQLFIETSTFTFLKVGDIGSNGTRYTGRIISRYPAIGDELLTIITNKDDGDNDVTYWNTSDKLRLSERVTMLQFQKYYNGQIAENKNTDYVTWEVPGSFFTEDHVETRFLSIDSDNGVCAIEDAGSGKVNQIVKGVLSYIDENNNNKLLNALLGIPYIKYYKKTDYNISFDKYLTLQSVQYANDGSNPSYNKNKGFSFKWDYAGDEVKYLVIEPQGGIDGNNQTANFEFILNKNDKPHSSISEHLWTKENPSWTTYPFIVQEISEELNEYMCYISPKDTYDGEWFNNNIHGRIYSAPNDYSGDDWVGLSQKETCEVEFWIPIIFYLNTYGYRWLNMWDGTHIEISEDGNYILAPQIGAGIKTENNNFTGLVMGIERQYSNKDERVGLFGFSDGRQSIFMDAHTGKTVLGTTDKVVSENNDYQPGQIILDPDGESLVGGWTLGERSFYNIVTEKGRHSTKIGDPYRDRFTEGHKEDISPKDSGILISSEPAYICIKGNKNTVSGQNSYENEKDEFALQNLELLLDPNQKSIFSIFGHYQDREGNWQRKLKVGIDAKGRFFANSLQDNFNNLNISEIDAFGEENAYIGFSDEANISSDNNNPSNVTIFKAFTDKGQTGRTLSKTSPLYISGGSLENEYARPLYLYGKEIYLYADSVNSTQDNRRTSKTANNYLSITTKGLSLCNTSDSVVNSTMPTYLQHIERGLVVNRGGNFGFVSDKGFDFISPQMSYTYNSGVHDIQFATGKLRLRVNGKDIISYKNGYYEFVSGESYKASTDHGGLEIDKDGIRGKAGNTGFDLSNIGRSSFDVTKGIRLNIRGGSLDTSVADKNGINFETSNEGKTSRMKLTAGSNGSDGGFSVETPNGSIETGASVQDSMGTNQVATAFDQLITAPSLKLTSTIGSTGHSLEAVGSIYGSNFEFITDPIYDSSRTNSLIGGHLDGNGRPVSDMSLDQSKSLISQLNAIYIWSAKVYEWYQDHLRLNNVVEKFIDTYSNKDLPTLNKVISGLLENVNNINNQLSNGSNTSLEEFTNEITKEEKITTQHIVITSKEFYATDFVRDDDTVYFVVDS